MIKKLQLLHVWNFQIKCVLQINIEKDRRSWFVSRSVKKGNNLSDMKQYILHSRQYSISGQLHLEVCEPEKHPPFPHRVKQAFFIFLGGWGEEGVRSKEGKLILEKMVRGAGHFLFSYPYLGNSNYAMEKKKL